MTRIHKWCLIKQEGDQPLWREDSSISSSDNCLSPPIATIFLSPPYRWRGSSVSASSLPAQRFFLKHQQAACFQKQSSKQEEGSNPVLITSLEGEELKGNIPELGWGHQFSWKLLQLRSALNLLWPGPISAPILPWTRPSSSLPALTKFWRPAAAGVELPAVWVAHMMTSPALHQWIMYSYKYKVLTGLGCKFQFIKPLFPITNKYTDLEENTWKLKAPISAVVTTGMERCREKMHIRQQSEHESAAGFKRPKPC